MAATPRSRRELLGFLFTASRPLTVREIVDLTGLNISTAQHWLHTLRVERKVERLGHKFAYHYRAATK